MKTLYQFILENQENQELEIINKYLNTEFKTVVSNFFSQLKFNKNTLLNLNFVFKQNNNNVFFEGTIANFFKIFTPDFIKNLCNNENSLYAKFTNDPFKQFLYFIYVFEQYSFEQKSHNFIIEFVHDNNSQTLNKIEKFLIQKIKSNSFEIHNREIINLSKYLNLNHFIADFHSSNNYYVYVKKRCETLIQNLLKHLNYFHFFENNSFKNGIILHKLFDHLQSIEIKPPYLLSFKNNKIIISNYHEQFVTNDELQNIIDQLDEMFPSRVKSEDYLYKILKSSPFDIFILHGDVNIYNANIKSLLESLYHVDKVKLIVYIINYMNRDGKINHNFLLPKKYIEVYALNKEDQNKYIALPGRGVYVPMITAFDVLQFDSDDIKRLSRAIHDISYHSDLTGIAKLTDENLQFYQEFLNTKDVQDIIYYASINLDEIKENSLALFAKLHKFEWVGPILESASLELLNKILLTAANKLIKNLDVLEIYIGNEQHSSIGGKPINLGFGQKIDSDKEYETKRKRIDSEWFIDQERYNPVIAPAGASVYIYVGSTKTNNITNLLDDFAADFINYSGLGISPMIQTLKSKGSYKSIARLEFILPNNNSENDGNNRRPTRPRPKRPRSPKNPKTLVPV